ncbi:MAG: hypothetical protein IKU29_03690 [Parabacteroides sp.]|nr:hypothetical protein [Parabacteroides sp.]
MKNNYEELEEQIGEAGGDDGLVGKKLKHAASYGKKEELTKDEKTDMEAFLSRSAHKRENINIGDGWIPVNREELGIRSIFYRPNWEFFIKPATVNAIKNWTAIDENRPDQLNRTFNEICKSCIKIDSHDLSNVNWMNINSWDRFWFILKIREYTFAQGEAKIEFTDACSECDEDIVYKLDSNSLFYEFPDEDLVEKYWTGTEWSIDPREYGVDHEPITLYTPTLGKDDTIIEWATARANNRQKIDETFIKFLVWMLPRPSSDPQMTERQIQKIYNEYKSWDIDMFQFMDDVVRNITINPSEKLKCKCSHCGQEATSNVRFPDGIKVLFKTETRAQKFGSR